MVCCLSLAQAPIQAALRPAMWIPGLRNLHYHEEIWDLEKPASEAMDDLVTAVEKLSDQSPLNNTYVVHKVNKESGYVEVFAFTRCNWLDVVEIQFIQNQAKARSFSTGLIPVAAPLSFFINCILFWAPFYDWGLNANRLQEFRDAMRASISSNYAC